MAGGSAVGRRPAAEQGESIQKFGDFDWSKPGLSLVGRPDARALRAVDLCRDPAPVNNGRRGGGWRSETTARLAEPNRSAQGPVGDGLASSRSCRYKGVCLVEQKKHRGRDGATADNSPDIPSLFRFESEEDGLEELKLGTCKLMEGLKLGTCRLRRGSSGRNVSWTDTNIQNGSSLDSSMAFCFQINGDSS